MSEGIAALVLVFAMSSASAMSSSAVKIMERKSGTLAPVSKTLKKVKESITAPSKSLATAAQKQIAQTTPSVSVPSASKITAPVATRVSEMRDTLPNMSAGRRTTKQMTGSDGRVYFVVPNGFENEQLAWLEELTSFAKKLYASAVKRHGAGDVYTSRLGTLLQDSKVSYIHSNSWYAGDAPYTSLYPSGKKPPSGMLGYPYIVMNGWWETVDRRSVGSALFPKDVSWKPKVMPYALHLFMHEIGHAIAGLIGHNDLWVRAWHWTMQEAEAAGLWTNASLVATLNGEILNKDTFSFDPSRYYSWNPYTEAQLNKVIPWAKAVQERGQQDNLWTYSPGYKKGLGCPCT